MKAIIAVLILSCSPLILFAQLPQLDVEGHTKIRGNIDINHMDDSTSVFIGRNAGVNTTFTDIRYNTFVGSYAGYNNFDGAINSFFGRDAGHDNISGNFNSFFGNNAGHDNTSGSDNSFFGTSAGFNNTTGNLNSFFGNNAGGNNSWGAFNSFFGSNAGSNNTSGTRNTFIGYGAIQVNFGDSLDRAVAIGYKAKVNCSHCAVIGGTGADAVKLGIGVDSPSVVLTLLAPNGADPVGITQGQVGGGSTMELTTEDNSSQQATRILVRGGDDASDIEFYRGARGAEIVSLFVEGLNGNVGIGTTSPTFQLELSSNSAGKPGGGVWSNSSDIRLKKNISDYSDGLTAILNIHPVWYQYNKKAGYNTDERYVGVIAQELEKIAPYMVGQNEIDGETYLTVNNSAMTYMLINAVKEQQTEIDQLKQEIASLINLIKDQ